MATLVKGWLVVMRLESAKSDWVVSISTSLESEVDTANPSFLARLIGFLNFEILMVSSSVQPSS